MPTELQPPSPGDRPLGQLFTEVYRSRGEPRQDDERFRIQLHQAFTDIFHERDKSGFAKYLRSEAGVEVEYHWGATAAVFHWIEYFKGCSLEDLLDLVTHLVRFAESRRLDTQVESWLESVHRALVNRNLAYDVDGRGGMHHQVDAAFQRSKELTLSCLATARFHGARTETEASFDFLTNVHPDRKMAVVNIFLAAENVFMLIAGTGTPLTSASSEREIRPIIQRRYAGLDPTANQSANKVISSFADWVDACHPYRHGQMNPQIVAPPEALAIILVTQGADFIRWLVSLS